MTRYIDADLLMEKKIHHYALDYDYVTTDDIDDTPTADVVEVVRCKDCDYRGDPIACPIEGNDLHHISGYDFCSWGVPKDGDTE